MTSLQDLGLRARMALFFAALGFGGAAALAGGLAAQAAGLGLAAAAGGALAGFGALLAAVWWLFDRNVALPIERLSAALRARAHTGAGQIAEARHLGDLAPAVTAAAAELDQARGAALDRVARETAQLAAEAAGFRALLQALPAALVQVAADGRVVLHTNALPGVALDRPAPALPGPWVPCGAGRLWLAPDRGPDRGPEPGPERGGPGRLCHDFALLAAGPAAQADPVLAHLTCVVFDTETTGLLPAQGDEIVQIAGLRLVRGRDCGEWFDTLVHPGRTIPAAATAVHGITDAMVADAPAIAQAGQAFHAFCDGAVLVAHNAPFDMAFLQRQEIAMGCAFDHPVLDTMALSALVWGGAEPHDLDALCARLGVSLPPGLRHTALGDARATAEVFLRLLAILQGRGIATLGALQGALRGVAG